jgi:hypothetical protein
MSCGLVRFPFARDLAGFDFSAQPSIDRAQVREIAGSRFIINSEAVLLLGPPGVGKTRIWRSPSAVRRSSPATRRCFHAGDDVDGPALPRRMPMASSRSA